MSNITKTWEGRSEGKNQIKWYDNTGQRSSVEVKGQERIAKNVICQLFLQAKMANRYTLNQLEWGRGGGPNF